MNDQADDAKRSLFRPRLSMVTPSDPDRDISTLSEEVEDLETLLKDSERNPLVQSRIVVPGSIYEPTAFTQAALRSGAATRPKISIQGPIRVINPLATPSITSNNVLLQKVELETELNAARFSNMDPPIVDIIQDMRSQFAAEIKSMQDQLNASKAMVIESNENTINLVQQLRDMMAEQLQQIRSNNNSNPSAAPSPNVKFADETLIDDHVADITMRSTNSFNDVVTEAKHDHNGRAKFVQMYLDEVSKVVASSPLAPIVSGPNALQSLLKLEKTWKLI